MAKGGRRDLTNLLGGEWKGKGLAIILNNYPALPCLVLSYLYSDYLVLASVIDIATFADLSILLHLGCRRANGWIYE